MTALLFILVAVVLLAVAVLVDVVLDDPIGLGRHEPPRSHPGEHFDPHRARLW